MWVTDTKCKAGSVPQTKAWGRGGVSSGNTEIKEDMWSKSLRSNINIFLTGKKTKHRKRCGRVH